MKVFFRILQFARPVGWMIPQYLVLILLATGFSVVNLTALIPLLEVLFGQLTESTGVASSWNVHAIRELFYQYLHQLTVAHGQLSALYLVCILVVCSVILANVFRYLSQLLLAKLRVQTITRLRNAAFEAITSFNLRFLIAQKKGDLISRVTMDVQEVEQSVVSAMKVLFKEPFLVVGYLTALWMISAQLTVYTLLLIPVAGLAVSQVARKIRVWARRSQKSLGWMSSAVEESISGMRIIQAFEATGYVRRRFSGLVKVFATENFAMAAKSNLAAPISELMGVGILVVVLIIGGKMVLTKPSELDAAQFIGFLAIFSQLLNPVKAIAVALSQITRGIGAGERVFELIDHSDIPEHSEGHLSLPEFQNNIQFEKVTFSYGGHVILKDLSFAIPKGKTVALVGFSGAGKSTLADLLCRFLDPDSGCITLDGVNFRGIRASAWRAKIGLVSQEPLLFHDTIKANITFGLEQVTSEELDEVARLAGIDELISRLPEGYETVIGDRGNQLSGGQKQRVALARALVRNPELLILDEATSALDSRSEAQILDDLKKFMRDRTCLVIAHRLSTVQKADIIYVLDAGRIVQQGTHQELHRSEGLYRQLTELQSFS